MRMSTAEATTAFWNYRKYHNGNTSVHVGDDGAILMLHGHVIAIKNYDGTLQVTHAGWPTMTTKERLNGLPGVGIHQEAGIWYLNGEEWDGALRTV